MGSLNGRLERLEGRLDISKTEAEREEERRKAEVRERINDELRALEARRRSRTQEEQEAWRNSPQQLARRAAFEEHERRRRGEA